MPAVIAGLSRLTQQLNQVGLEFTSEDLVKGAEVIMKRALELVPYDTGELWDSAFIQDGGDDVELGFSADHASYVEFGTYKMAAQPYLRPAIDEMEAAALSAIVDSVQSHMRDITK
jgi:HK97 gp10 family phage protein